MQLTPAQRTALKADLAANNNTVLIGDVATPIKNVDLTNADNAFAVAAWYSQVASIAYWVWKNSITRSEVYNSTSDLGTSWDWVIYTTQTVPQQGGWTQMFMSDAMDPSQLNNRLAVSHIFGNSNAETLYCFAIFRRQATNIEKLFATAVPNPPANSGNDGVAGNRGKASNPDLFGTDANGQAIVGAIDGSTIQDAAANG